MKLEYVDINKELPPIGERVRVRPNKEIWLDDHYFINFIPGKEYYGKLAIVRSSFCNTKTELVWDIEEFDNCHLPQKIFSYWVKEIFKPINSRFELLDIRK